MNNQIESLDNYCKNVFKDLPIIPKVEPIILAGEQKFNILFNGKNYVADTEVLAWTFIDGLYLGITETKKP